MTQKKTAKSILAWVAKLRALGKQKSQFLLSKGHQTHHSSSKKGLERFRHITVLYEPAINDQLRRHSIFTRNCYLDNYFQIRISGEFLATEQNKLKSTEMFVCKM